MNRLEPILKQKFWILLGVAITMTITGWWLTTSEMAVQIKARETDIQKAFSSVPTGKIPNDNWVNELGSINAAQDRSIVETRRSLWQRQIAELDDWPQDVKPNRGYPEGIFTREGKQEYAEAIYRDEVVKTHKRLHPLEADGTGLVYYPLGNMYTILRRQPNWKDLITDKEMWEIKEDLSLLGSLFDSIAAVNGGIGDQLRTTDMIHQIDVLELHGGGPTKPKASPPFVPPFATMVAPLMHIPPDFNVAEEWGEDGSVTAARTFAAAPQAATAQSSGGAFGRVIDDDAPSTPTFGATAAPAKPVTRYIQDDASLPYKTRGFYLSVKMDHLKIPQLIAELTANNRSVWPVEVTRVQMSRLHEDAGSGGATNSPAGRRVPGPSSPVGLDDSAGGDEDRPLGGLIGIPVGGPLAGRPMGALGQAPPDPALTSVELTRAAKASLDKALAHPNMAQVTLCGVFTLYQKTADQPAASSPVAPPVSAPAATPDNQAPPEATDDTKPATDATDNTNPPAADTTNPATDAGNEPAPAADSPPADPAAETPADPNKDPADEPEPGPAKKEEPQ